MALPSWGLSVAASAFGGAEAGSAIDGPFTMAPITGRSRFVAMLGRASPFLVAHLIDQLSNEAVPVLYSFPCYPFDRYIPHPIIPMTTPAPEIRQDKTSEGPALT